MDHLLQILLPVAILGILAGTAARGTFSRSTLILQRFSIGQEPSPDFTPLIEIVGRNEGIVAFILTLMGFSPITRFTIAGSELHCQSSSLFGQRSQFIPLKCVSSLGAGIHKPLFSLFLAILLIIGGVYISFELHSWAPIAIALIFAVLFVVSYVLTKKFYIEVFSNGGPPVSLLFKPNVLEGVPIDAEQALDVVRVIRDLILHHVAADSASAARVVVDGESRSRAKQGSASHEPLVLSKRDKDIGSNSEIEAKALFEKARQYASTNQKQAAVPVLQELVRRFPQSSFAEQAKRILVKYKSES